MDKETLIVDGFEFPSFGEAKTAMEEKKNIEVIRERMPVNSGKACFDLYTKLIERDMFQTVVGYSFLYELRKKLITEFDYEETALPTAALPKRMEYDRVKELNQGVLASKYERLQVTQKRLQIVVVALVIMVVAMFVIAAINPNAGYLNVENKVVDKYAAWQEELEQREQAVKEKEAELNTGNKK